MTPEIIALIGAGLDLIPKIVDLIKAVQAGDVTAAEELKSLTEHAGNMTKIKSDLRQYLDDQFDKG
jgi:hypothetical protein